MNYSIDPLCLQVLKAYTIGAFPMGNKNNELDWYCPSKRCVFFLDEFRYHKRLDRKIKKNIFDIRVNENLKLTMQKCANRPDTWITPQIYDIYTELNRSGYAHSVEAYANGELVGGLYGVAIGGAFMGESMFHTQTDASKVCLVYLVERLKSKGFIILDCQFATSHLQSFGAKIITHDEYIEILNKALTLNVNFLDKVY